MKLVYEIMSKVLHEHNVEYIFGIPGGGWIDYIQALHKEKVKFILVSNEASAGFMAATVGRLTGNPGVCYATLGPGATNLSTGVGCAYLDRNPLIAFTHEVSMKFMDRRTQMGIDHQGLFRPITKWTTRLCKEGIKDILNESFDIARSEVPGPVHIGIPSDLENSEEIFKSQKVISEKIMNLLTPEYKQNIKKLFYNSRKPILAVGLSAVRAGVHHLINEFINKHKIPVVLTPMAKGIISESNTMYTGVLFHALQNYVVKTCNEADLVLGIGYDPVEYNYEDWLPNVPLIHVDSRISDISGNSNHVMDVVSEIKPCIEYLLSLPEVENDWDEKILLQRKNDMFHKFEPSVDFGPNTILSNLREHLPKDGILTCDVGAHTHLIGQMWRTPSPECLIMTNGWSSMGFGIPAAIAAKLVYPGRNVVCVTGDGGFLMMAGEMATVKRLGINIVFIVLIDRELSLIRLKQERKGYLLNGTNLFHWAHRSPNSYFGVPVIEARDRDSYKKALKEAFSLNSSVIIEAFIDGSEYEELVLK